MINGGVAALIALYLIVVLRNDKEDELIALIKSEGGFIKWIGALLLLMIIYNLTGGKIGEILQQLTLLALAGLLMQKGEVIFKNLGDTFK